MDVQVNVRPNPELCARLEFRFWRQAWRRFIEHGIGTVHPDLSYHDLFTTGEIGITTS